MVRPTIRTRAGQRQAPKGSTTGQTTIGRIEIEGTGSDGKIPDGSGVGVGAGVGCGVGVGVGVAGGRLGAGVGVGRAVGRGVAGATVARGTGVGVLDAGDAPAAPYAVAPGPDGPADPLDGEVASPGAPDPAIVPLGATDGDGLADTATGGTTTGSSTTGPAGAGTIAVNATATATVMSSPKPTPTAVSRYSGSIDRMGHLRGGRLEERAGPGDGPSRGYARALLPGSAAPPPCGAPGHPRMGPPTCAYADLVPRSAAATSRGR